MTRNGQVHDGSADKFALRKTLRRHRGYPGGVDWHWRTLRLRRRNGAHTGKRLAGKLHEPFERAGGGRAQAPPPPTLQLGSRRTKRSNPPRSRWSEGRGPRGMRTSKARTGLRARLACHRRWSAYGKHLPSRTQGGSRMRESRTYGSVRGARDETRVPTATCASRKLVRSSRWKSGPS